MRVLLLQGRDGAEAAFVGDAHAAEILRDRAEGVVDMSHETGVGNVSRPRGHIRHDHFGGFAGAEGGDRREGYDGAERESFQMFH